MAGLNQILKAVHWRPKIKQCLVELSETAPGVTGDAPLYIGFDNRIVIQNNMDEGQLARLRTKFDQQAGLQFNVDGDKYVCISNDEQYWGIRIMPGPNTVDVTLLCRTAFEPPGDLVAMNYDFFRVLATLWKHAI